MCQNGFVSASRQGNKVEEATRYESIMNMHYASAGDSKVKKRLHNPHSDPSHLVFTRTPSGIGMIWWIQYIHTTVHPSQMNR